MGPVKLLAIIVVIIFLFIVYIIDDNFRKKIFKFLNKNIFKTRIKIKNVLVIIILIILIVYLAKLLINSKENIDFASKDMTDSENQLNETLDVAKVQSKKYDEIFKIQTNIENCKNPYIPDKFEYLEGSWDTGFVIQDENKNQFVWIPCTNIENDDGIPILKKEILDEYNTSYFSCYENDDYEDFLRSSLDNGGFYISRYEIGKEDEKPVSKENVKVWTNIDWNEAEKISKNMYSNINSRLINGYGYDTAVKFILDEVDKNNIPESTGTTGNKAYKNIYDLVDDMEEWTSEMKHNLPILRGSIFDYFAERFVNEESYKADNLGFRTIIYK